MNITEIVIATLVVAAIALGSNLFMGSVFTSFNTTQSTEFTSKYQNYTGILNASKEAYNVVQQPTTPTSPFILGYVLAGWNGLKAIVKGLATAVNFPNMVKNTTQQAGYGFGGFNDFVAIAVAIVLVSIVGYLIYLLLGKGVIRGGGAGV